MAGPSDAPAAASEAPAASMRIEMAPGGGAPASGAPTGEGPIAGAPASQDPLGYGGGGGGTGGGISGTSAATPAADLHPLGTGGGGPIAPNAADPKAGDGREQASAAPGDEYATTQSLDASVPTAPATAPLFVLATVLLIAGATLGGLRLIARRTA